MRTKIFHTAALMVVAMTATTLTSCLNNDEETIVLEEEKLYNNFENDYFYIDGADWENGAMPASSTHNSLTGTGSVNYNTYGLQGGFNFISFTSGQHYKYVLVGVKGENGYWRYKVNPQSLGDSYLYEIPINYGTHYSKDITIWLIGVLNTNGEDTYTDPYNANVKYERDGLTGDININLTFNTPKDVDLHLEMPNGSHIYYGKRNGGFASVDLLDHDSNAGCDIDNLNNENIVIPADYVTSGTYTVYVDLYQNCTSSYSTSWTVAARYKGSYVTNELGSHKNPVSGTYAANARSGDMTPVIKFTLSRSQVGTRTIKELPDIPYQLTEKDELKLFWRANEE